MANPRLFITGATGQLGRLVVDALLGELPADRVVAGVRDPAKDQAMALRNKGVETRIADYGRPDTLRQAFAGIDRLLLISGSELGQRTTQHRAVIDAAKAAGVGLIAYTSILHMDTSPLFLAEEHRATEQALTGSGVPWVMLRNGWYTEVFTWRLPLALSRGSLAGAAGEGRISAAARADYAQAAATVVAGDGHAGRIYELAGDNAFTMVELAAVASAAAAKPIAYDDMPPDRLRATLRDAGVPAMFADIMADTDAGVRKGALFDDGGALARLIGRPTTPYRTTITDFVQSQGSPGSGQGHG